LTRRLVNKDWGKVNIKRIKMIGNTTHLSLTLNVNGLNAQLKDIG
jgi:hypothetical protein